ncbi:MAG: phage tail assembly protein [Clostridia bacterium]|nr:phage tail assembly protein [Clostridia bacterium]
MKKTWEEAMKVAKAMCEGQEVSEEKLESFATKIMEYEEETTMADKNDTECEEIAKGEPEHEDVIIGSGIVAEAEGEKNQEKEEDDFIIRFQKPYRFEGKSYAGVDLSGLKSLRAKDVWKINRNYRNAGNIGLLQEMDSEYTARVAARASGMPVEFFEGMELPDMIKVRTKVSDFFYPRE